MEKLTKVELIQKIKMYLSKPKNLRDIEHKNEIIKYAGKILFFRKFHNPKEILSKLLDFFQVHYVSKDTVFFNQGDKIEKLHILLQGKMKVIDSNLNKQVFTINNCEGIGELQFVSNKSINYKIVAQEDCFLVSIGNQASNFIKKKLLQVQTDCVIKMQSNEIYNEILFDQLSDLITEGIYINMSQGNIIVKQNAKVQNNLAFIIEEGEFMGYTESSEIKSQRSSNKQLLKNLFHQNKQQKIMKFKSGQIIGEELLFEDKIGFQIACFSSSASVIGIPKQKLADLLQPFPKLFQQLKLKIALRQDKVAQERLKTQENEKEQQQSTQQQLTSNNYLNSEESIMLSEKLQIPNNSQQFPVNQNTTILQHHSYQNKLQTPPTNFRSALNHQRRTNTSGNPQGHVSGLQKRSIPKVNLKLLTKKSNLDDQNQKDFLNCYQYKNIQENKQKNILLSRPNNNSCGNLGSILGNLKLLNYNDFYNNSTFEPKQQQQSQQNSSQQQKRSIEHNHNFSVGNLQKVLQTETSDEQKNQQQNQEYYIKHQHQQQQKSHAKYSSSIQLPMLSSKIEDDIVKPQQQQQDQNNNINNNNSNNNEVQERPSTPCFSMNTQANTNNSGNSSQENRNFSNLISSASNSQVYSQNSQSNIAISQDIFASRNNTVQDIFHSKSQPFQQQFKTINNSSSKKVLYDSLKNYTNNNEQIENNIQSAKNQYSRNQQQQLQVNVFAPPKKMQSSLKLQAPIIHNGDNNYFQIKSVPKKQSKQTFNHFYQNNIGQKNMQLYEEDLMDNEFAISHEFDDKNDENINQLENNNNQQKQNQLDVSFY